MARGPKGRRWRHLPAWNRRKRLTIEVLYTGGAEGWFDIKARGSSGRIPGDRALVDVMQEVWNGGRF